MRSSLIAAFLLTVGMYAPASSVSQQVSVAPPQAQTVPRQRQARTGLDHQTAHRSRASIATNTPPMQLESGNRKMPAPVGLLLALGLLDGGAAPHQTRQTEIH
jgi:hypothetical protein